MWSHYGDRHKGICLGFDVPDEKTRKVVYVDDIWSIGHLDDLSTEEKTNIIDRLYEAKYGGWRYEEEIRIHGSREEVDEETGKCFIKFSEELRLREVIAGAKFPMSRKPIDDAIQGYSEDVRIAKADRSTSRFEIVADERGFR